MVNVSKEVPLITYDQLSKMLASLGFVRKETDQFTVFGEQEHDALIVLPRMKAETEIGDPYLVTVRNTVVGRGVTSLENINSIFASFGSQSAMSRLRLRTPRSRHASVKPRSPRSKGSIKKHPAPASQE